MKKPKNNKDIIEKSEAYGDDIPAEDPLFKQKKVRKGQAK